MNQNSTNSLDLYSKVEDMLGVKEVAPKLYAHYITTLSSIEFDSLLDVGCGSGDFLRSVSATFHTTSTYGIDLSPHMVAKAKKINDNIECIDLCAVQNRYDIITATFDMINYLNTKSLARFLNCLSDKLNDGGYFLCDINTLYGFSEVAVGSFIADEDDMFLTIDSDFEEGIYSSEFTLFEREGELYRKSKEQITQYYHTATKIAELARFELVSQNPISLYADESDKSFLVFKKRI